MTNARLEGSGLTLIVLFGLVGLAGCGMNMASSNSGGGLGGGETGSGGSTKPQVATPVITTTAALNGAVVVSLSDATAGASLYYTTDGSVPTSSSQAYRSPFLIASNLTVRVVAELSGETNSDLTSEVFAPNLSPGTLVFSDEFSNPTGLNPEPNPSLWTYDTGNGGFGNNELETYCAWGSTTSPCNSSLPNVYVGTEGYLHIVAREPSAGVYTSARLKSQGLFSFQYGRLEVRASVPEYPGLWPTAWLMGNTYETVGWPACGELDVLERVNAPTSPDYNLGSIHGPGFTGTSLGTKYHFGSGVTASTFHTYGMIWEPGSVAYYVDDPSDPYVTYTPASLASITGASWPFDAGDADFILLNLAVGGNYPGSPNASTVFPSEMLVDYVRLYTK